MLKSLVIVLAMGAANAFFAPSPTLSKWAQGLRTVTWTVLNAGMDLPPCTIKVIGVGGGGSNAVLRMVEYGVKGVDFVIMNTDAQALARAPEGVEVLALGQELTGGLGASGIANVGREAAEESQEAEKPLVV